MGGFMIIIPMLILIVLRTFLPSVESTSAHIAVVTSGVHAVEPGLIEALEEYADISTYSSIDAMERKLRGTGSAEGLYWDPDKEQYVSVLERSIEKNKLFSVSATVVRQYMLRKENPDAPDINRFTHRVPQELSDRSKTSPVATMGGAVFITYILILGGFIIGLNLVNDKEEGTHNAIKVSPVSKSDYFIGKSIFPFLIVLAYTIIGLLVLRLGHVNILQTYIVSIISFSATLLFGLIIGALGTNENEAIGYAKILAMVVMLSIIGGMLLPDRWQWVVWWSPLYWIYNGLEGIFTESAVWGTLIYKIALIFGLTGFFFLLLRKKIAKGLS